LQAVVKAPVVWAALLALVVNLTGVPMPEWAGKAIDLVGSAGVPVMLLVLGIQLSRLSLAEGGRTIAAATAIKLVVAPVLAAGVAAVLGMQGVVRHVGILQAGTPAAVTATILTAEYDSAPRLASGAVFASTVLSIVSLTVLLAWLR
jgi:predicted permease